MIVHVITGLGRGGAENALYRLLTTAKDPEQVRVVSLSDEGIFAARIRALGIEVHCLGMRGVFPSPFRSAGLVALLRRWQPRMVQTWMYHADLVGGLAARMAGVPVCWGIRQGDLSARLNKRSTRLVAWCCARLSTRVPLRIISCSHRAVESHRKFGYRGRFEVVHNGVDIVLRSLNPAQRAEVLGELGISEDTFVFAHVGRADPQKDHASLARAFSCVASRHAGLRLLVCGKGMASGDAYLSSLPFSPEASRCLIALGERDDLQRLLGVVDAFVLSSLGEAFPNVLAEAMASGIPCVSTDAGDARDIIGETGFVVPTGDTAALANAMEQMLLLSPDARGRLGEAARKRVERMFGLHAMRAGFERVWQAAIDERNE